MKFAWITVLLFTVLLVGTTWAEETQAQPNQAQPNIVLVFIDDMGWADFSFSATKMQKHRISTEWRRRELLSSSFMSTRLFVPPLALRS